MHTLDSICKLCKTNAPLCRSHIVPELAYKPLKNAKNQIYSLGRKVRKVQTGYYEMLLCANCESLLSELETRFSAVWMDTVPQDFSHLTTRSFVDTISVGVPDYSAFKLFHLSVFWRAAVSRGFKLGQYTLGRFERELANLIMLKDPGRDGDFPFLATLILDPNSQPARTVAPLIKGEGRFEGHHYYMMTYAYCDWLFVIARPGPIWMQELETLYRREGVFLVHPVPRAESKSFKLWVDIIRDLRK